MPYADGDGARLYYEAEGAGEPLLFIPGFGSTVEVYWANQPALARRFRTIAFDPRGSGRSDVPAEGYSMQVFANDCVAVMRADGHESAHVFATSFGSMVAQHLALDHPQRVRRMMLGCTSTGGEHHVRPEPVQIATFLAAGDIPDPIAALRSTYPLHYSDAYTAEHDAALVERAQRNAHLRSTAQGRLGHLTAISLHDTYDRLPEITAPVIVAHGALDGIIPVENGRVVASRIPGARLHVFPDAKHMFFVECAEALNREVTAFFLGGAEAEEAS